MQLEYDAARTKAVFAERLDRAFLRVYGRDPLRIIQGIVSNDVTGASPDRAVYAAMLTPKGRMVADVRVIRRGADLLLDVPADALDSLLDLFKRTIPPLFARFENVTATFAMCSIYGPAAREAARTVAGQLPALPAQDGFAATGDNEDTVLAMTTLDTGTPGYDLLVHATHAEAIRTRLLEAGALPISHNTREVLRIEAGTPRWGAELDENTIPIEAGLLERAISTNKGCYTGQEVIIRVLHRGHVNWHLRGLLLGDIDPPPAGTAIIDLVASKKIGRITSATRSPAHRQTIALAYIRREVTPPATAHLELPNNPPTHVVSLPFTPAT
jgi:folate-binding protein YgfZ